MFPGHERLRHWFFAGNHSDVGGSYPEPEFRLSDVALEWMCREAMSVRSGLLTGPIFVDGTKMEGTGDGQALHIRPDGMQHSEIAGMRDSIEAMADSLPNWAWLRRLLGRQNWEIKIRDIGTESKVHPTAARRFDLPAVVQCGAGTAPYRQEALAEHFDFNRYYPVTRA